MRGYIRERMQQDPSGALEDYRHALKVAPEGWKYRNQVSAKVRELEQQLGEE